MLKRQPAIEMPVGVDLTSEAGICVSTESGWKQQKGIQLYECEICGTHLKKQDSYEAHRVSCMNKPSQEQQCEKKVATEQEDHRQIMHYKFKAMAMAIRKRRKEESLEEDPPSPGPAAISFSTSGIGKKDDFQGFSGTGPQIEPEKIGAYKEISVIQHTSSFEKQESMSVDIQESEVEHKQSEEPKQTTTTSRLVRQPKIQVPEILVTKEPDSEMVSPPASTYLPKELEKEEFQWPQRSQSLAQLPAEKLPPKKKRLRLAEAPQSSGESSFESVSLPRSPSQESNVSHTSSRSTSFDETGKIDPEMQAGTWSSQASHMLTVPGAYQHYHREMHRSASEQAPASPPHPAQIVETRSKSFDCGSLSPRPTSSSWKERRKCLLVKHATLEKPDQEESSSSIQQAYSGHAALTVEFRPESASDDSCGPLCAGGNKRMLSPAGSLELSLEAQRQQKRIKEEEEAEESGEESKSCEKFLEENPGANKGALRNRKGVDVVVEKEQGGEEKKTEFVVNKPEISQVEIGVKKEEHQEEGHRCVSVFEIPERSTDSTNPLYPSLHTSTSQMYSSEVYTMATTPTLTTDKLVGSKTPRVSEVHAKTLSTPVKEKEEPQTKRVEKDVRSTEETPTTSKHSELRVCIFEGGYKSNEEYVYVRGRGRGKYVCGECGIRCKKPSMLKKHIRTHTDIRPYVCKHCNFAFKTKGNLTKHMKSKAHGKKCLEKGVSESSVDELDTEEAGTSSFSNMYVKFSSLIGPVGISEGHVYESEDQEEHQFSDIEDSEDEDDDDNEEEEEDLSSHDDAPSSCSTDTHQSDSGPGSQTGPSSLTVSEKEERENQLSPIQAWRSGHTVSLDTKRALFSSKAWEHSPRNFSPTSEGSPLRSVSPRLELSSPCRHLSPSPERGPSPLTASPLRSFSPLRPLSPARYRSSRARLSPTPFKTQHRAHSSPGHFHWEPSTKSRESQQERPSTPSTAQTSQRLSPPHASLVPSALHFPHSDPPIHVPAPSRTMDRMFSHLPLHSQQQARMPYHMIPIGGIQMVQLRPRSCPKLERASSSTQSPISPKEEFTFSLSKSSWSTPWNVQSETSQSVSGTQTLEQESKPLGLHCPATSSTTAKSSPPYDSGKQNKKKNSKQYGSSWPSKTHTIVPERSQEAGQDIFEGDKRSSAGSEKGSRVSLPRKSEQSEPEEPKESQSKNDPALEGTAEEKSVHSDQSQDCNPDST
ncbi:hypothetical protein QTP86_005901 [Hemibagrus guttatus]|nr:hypothetical protein QTP86_005901 [Hemibagrus guttatus]